MNKAEKAKAYREELKAEGYCPRCYKRKAVAGKLHCKECEKYYYAYYHAHKAQRLEYEKQRRDVLYIYIPKRGYIRDLNHDCTELLYTDKEHEAKVFMYIDGIRGVLSYMKLVKNAGVTLPDYYIVTNGVKEQVAKIHF